MEGAHFWAGHVSLFESRWSFSQRRAQCALSLNKGFLKYHLAIKRDDGKSIVDDLPMLARIDIYIYIHIYIYTYIYMNDISSYLQIHPPGLGIGYD